MVKAVTRIGDADVAHCSGMTRAVGSGDVFANGIGISRQGDNNTRSSKTTSGLCCSWCTDYNWFNHSLCEWKRLWRRVGDGITGCTSVARQVLQMFWWRIRMANPNIPNLCGANPNLNGALSKIEELKDKLLSNIDVDASTLKSELEEGLDELTSAFDKLEVELPEAPAVNFQAEITSLINDINKTSIAGITETMQNSQL